MTSEIFKDKLQGCSITIEKSGQDCLDALEEKTFDMIVLDFDLPDTDGVTLTKILRKQFTGPILITAFPDNVVNQAVSEELFAYDDSCNWLSKPLKSKKLAELIDKFLVSNNRVLKRFETQIDATLIGKGEGRGKRAPKVSGNIINISIGGAFVQFNQQMKMKAGDEITLNLFQTLAGEEKTSKKSTKEKSASTGKSKSKSKKTKSALNPKDFDPTTLKNLSKIKANIAWASKSKKEAGINFSKLSDSHRKAIEEILRQSSSLDEQK